MTEVALQNGSGQAAKLGTLAERINDEHRACVAAAGSALVHAIEAGRVFQEVKDSLPHKEWGPWLAANFAASDRTDRGYRQLYRDREKLKGQNGNGVATLSLREALKSIAEAQRPPKPKPLWGPDPFANRPEGLEPEPAVLKGWEEDQAAIAMWRKQNREALEKVRAEDRAKGLRSILLGLDDLRRRYPPEEAGAALARMAGEGRALEAVGQCIAWLQQTLQEAEREQGLMQDAE
jgi:hypothetical protein